MLRRDPTTIHLVAEDIKDIGRGDDFGIVQQPDMMDSDAKGRFDTDNQNWDSSLDESYLGSRSRERDAKAEPERGNVESMEGLNSEPTQQQHQNSLLRNLNETESHHYQQQMHHDDFDTNKPN
ncbi:hypothetical protein C6P40_002957 [Pichia californica]|uniref:Uncharacterized protein n=1 Tax=Pichia californica TaxID=460514 RepID=A0A9P6WJS6_9ASCO|nr:hypothetical protein C6P42_002751 [[Candida] californica]KAG0687053.1 hypothetical protein C6P40_002957 [[Candida] californica]